MQYNDETMTCLLTALEAKDRSLLEHSLHTAHIAQMIASILMADGFADVLPSCEDIMIIGMVHDIGKLNIPDTILQKKSSLTKRESENVKYHPAWGAKFLLKIPSLKHFAVYVHQHHEMPDGSGYPLRLTMEHIHPAARLINICDRFSAMTIDRPYRKAIGPEYAMTILEKDVELFFGTKNKRSITQCLLSMRNIQYIAMDNHSHPLIKKIFTSD